LFFGFLFWIGWLALERFPRWFAVLSVVIALSLNFTLSATRQPCIRALGRIADEFNEIAGKVEPGSVVFPVNFSSNWILFHVINYLGVERSIVILDNYECGQPYFPLKWKPGKEDMVNHINTTYQEILIPLSDTSKTYDYVLTFTGPDVKTPVDYQRFRLFLNQNFIHVATSPSGYIMLYRQKKQNIANKTHIG
jgi:hypothetical protein